MWRLLTLCALLAAVGAESVRETAIMNSAGDIFSGALPDDEDLISPGSERGIVVEEFDGEDDIEDLDYASGSGEISDTDETTEVPESPIDNHIPDGGPGKTNKGTEDEELVRSNEVVPERSAPRPAADSNEIPMAITGPENFFQRTDVVIALAAGGVVGLLFAVFLVLLLYFRMKKKDEGTYDLGKKPIYKKAPTNEIYA
ncbi:syndecan-4 [Ambystoma mexicanum]|uniref:syndecan-4 n=1 Tax=Ambystoma mexicanum TaxID=8296 RepID=UPI0037E79FDB